jgi:hypothetical protein
MDRVRRLADGLSTFPKTFVVAISKSDQKLLTGDGLSASAVVYKKSEIK